MSALSLTAFLPPQTHQAFELPTEEETKEMLKCLQEMKRRPSSRQFLVDIDRLERMVKGGCSVAQFRREVKSSLGDLNDVAKSFWQSRTVYQGKKEHARGQMDRLDAALQNDELSFPSFAPSEDHAAASDHSKDFQSVLTNWTTGKIGHYIHHLRGPTRALTYEMLAHSLLDRKPGHSSSPYRDVCISAAVHTGLSEVMQLALSRTNMAACTVMMAADTMSLGARRMEPIFDRLSQDRGVAEIWNRQWLLSGQEGPNFASAVAAVSCSLKLAQIPSQLMDSIHHEISDFIVHAGDRMGLTDEAVSQVAERALDHVAQHSPALLEKEFWEDIRE